MSDEYKKKFNEYIGEHNSILEMIKKSELFQAISKKAEEEDGEGVNALEELAAKHAAEVQPILDHFLEVMSDPKDAAKMLQKLGANLQKEE